MVYEVDQPDPTDREIISLLQTNAKMTFKEIGELVHMTGQAVGVRVARLLEDGVIDRFTIAVNPEKLGIQVVAIVKVIMATSDHLQILKIIKATDEIVEAHRVSGEGCYQLKIEAPNHQRLNEILDSMAGIANYQLSLSIGRIK